MLSWLRCRPPICHAVAVTLVLLGAAPGVAQSVGIDFGGTRGEDTLLGGSGSNAPTVSGGSYRSEPRDFRRSARADGAVGGWYQGARTSSSILHVHARPSSSYFRGTGIFSNAQGSGGSVLYYAAPPRGDDRAREIGPKIIDVASQRLDHRAVGPDGISVHYVGSTKIIRLAAGYDGRERERSPGKDMAALPEPASAEPPVRQPAAVPAAAQVPLPAPRPDGNASRAAPAEEPIADDAAVELPVPDAPVDAQTTAPSLEPWTDEWLADCVARHESFDASLGTYTGEDGRRRFCTGEPV